MANPRGPAMSDEQRAVYDASRRTNELDAAIQELIEEFERETNAEVTSIDVNAPGADKRVYVLWRTEDTDGQSQVQT